MYKLLIVGNEPGFREYLRNHIDWHVYGFEICGEAQTGPDALALAKQAMPDLVLADVGIPPMDGLSLSEELKWMNESICIVLFSSRNEFRYAQKAIKIGVDDYILKPVDENELNTALLRVSVKLLRLRHEKRIHAAFSFPIQEQYLIRMLDRNCTTIVAESNDLKRLINSLDPCEAYTVTTIEIDILNDTWSDMTRIPDCRNTVMNVISDVFGNRCSHIVFSSMDYRVISIIGTDGTEQADSEMTALYQQICDRVAKHYDFTVTIARGIPVHDLAVVRHSFHASLGAIELKTIFGSGKVLRYSDAKTGMSSRFLYPSVPYDKVLMLLRQNDHERVRCEVERIFRECIENNMPPDCIMSVAMGLKSVCLSYISEMGLRPGEVLGSRYTPAQIVSDISLAERARLRIMELFGTTLAFFSRTKPGRAQTIIAKIKAYIDTNYFDSDLTLHKIASHLLLNPDYVRRVFRKETNVTLTDYVTAVRMEKARELITRKRAKLSAICHSVGISDASYFSKCFKKRYGVSPNEYRNAQRLSVESGSACEKTDNPRNPRLILSNGTSNHANRSD